MSLDWAAEVSPFIFDGPLAADAVVGRQQEADVLRAWARAGRFVSLYAPRRFGKTSLLRKVAKEAGDQDAMPVVIVDLYGALSMADIVIRLERAYRDHATGKFRQLVSNALQGGQLGLSLAGTGFSVQMARQPRTDPLPALHALLELPADIQRRADGMRVLIVFDEFQSVLAVDGAEALLRSHIQHQREFASYIFCGSEPGLLHALFSDKTRPFYSQVESKRLGRLPGVAVAATIDAGFDETGRSAGDLIPPLVNAAEGHPQRAMLLAHCLWTATAPGETADEAMWNTAVDMARRRTAREFEIHWDGLSPNQRRVLRALVRFGSPYKKDAHAALQLARGTAQQVVDQLLRTGELERDDDAGLRVVDPLLRMWIDERFP